MNPSRRVLPISLLCFLFLSLTAVWAGVPNRIVYQGRLSKSGVAVAGNHVFTAQILSSGGDVLWSSGNMTVNLPATGDFTLVLEPSGVDWVNQSPKLRISVDGETLSPADSFSASPYALVAKDLDAGAAVDPSKIAISGSKTLADWRSFQNPEKIDANVILGSVPVSASQFVDPILVLNSTVTQTIKPTQNVVPLQIRPNAGASAAIDILQLQTEAGANAAVFHSTGDVTIAGRFRDKTGLVMPPGVILPYGGASAPAGWLLCDGSAVSRSTYADLFTAIGTAFGAGDGSTTFNLPDFRRRVPVGAGGTGTATLANTVGSAGGAETHTLTSAEMPSHTHGVGTYAVNSTNSSHTHQVDLPYNNISVASGGANFLQQTGGTTATYTSNANGSTHLHGLDGASASAGGGSAHNNLQPSLVVNCIVKY